MKIGVVTVLYKSQSVIEGFVKSLNAQTFVDYEVFIVENDVDDIFCEEYLRENARFQYFFVRNKENVGVARANNQGIDYFSEKHDVSHVMFLNNDIEVREDFFEAHKDIFCENKDVDALAPKMFYYGTNGKIWYAGGAISYLKEGPIHYGHNKPDMLRGNKLYRVSYAPTCSFLIKKDVLLASKVRMWEQLFVYQDDYVFCKELKAKGIRLYYAPNIFLQHKISVSTGGKSSDFSRYYLTRNWAYTMRKFRNVLVLVLPIVMALNLLRNRQIENKAILDSFRMP